MVTKVANKPKFKSDAFQAMHTSACALLKIGAINKTAMRGFDKSCLTVASDTQLRKIKKLREQTKLA
jgi:putative transcriptional regulator